MYVLNKRRENGPNIHVTTIIYRESSHNMPTAVIILDDFFFLICGLKNGRTATTKKNNLRSVQV